MSLGNIFLFFPLGWFSFHSMKLSRNTRFISSLIQVSGSESVLPANPNIQRLSVLSFDWRPIVCLIATNHWSSIGMDYTDWSSLGHMFHSQCPGSFFSQNTEVQRKWEVVLPKLNYIPTIAMHTKQISWGIKNGKHPLHPHAVTSAVE